MFVKENPDRKKKKEKKKKKKKRRPFAILNHGITIGSIHDQMPVKYIISEKKTSMMPATVYQNKDA